MPVAPPRQQGELTAGQRGLVVVDEPALASLHVDGARSALDGDATSTVGRADPAGEIRFPTPEPDSQRAVRIATHTVTHLPQTAKSPGELPPRERSASIPAPLLEPASTVGAPPVIAPAATSASVPAVPRQRAGTEPAAIHVHIDRIEVISAPEPAAPKKSRPGARNALPLSDYLARGRRR
jgi:hypothetical protein